MGCHPTCSGVKSKEPLQGLGGSKEDVYRDFARVPTSNFDWLLEQIKYIITKQHTKRPCEKR